MRASSELALLLAVVCLPALGCKQAPSKAPSPDQTSMPRDDGDLLVELDRLEQEMQRLGLRELGGDAGPSGAGVGAAWDGDDEYGAEQEEQPPAPSEAAAERAPRDRSAVRHCSDVCDLSEAICDLEVQICALAESHRDDPTYADACRRAGEDCELANQACNGCGS
ncbi:MAG: hypothetical protein R6X02_16475 [Enhygromyxa sp.]